MNKVATIMFQGGWISDKLQRRLARALKSEDFEMRMVPPPRLPEIINDQAGQALKLAQEEAKSFNHSYIGTEHILLGLLRQDEGIASQTLVRMGINLNKVRSVVVFIIRPGERASEGELGLTTRAKKVVELAVIESHNLGHSYIAPEHLLLGLIAEGEGIAAGMLEDFGVQLTDVRAQVLRELTRSPQSISS